MSVISRPVEISAIGAGGLVRRIEATEKERAELAVALDLVDVRALSAEVTLTLGKAGTVHVDGRVMAEIVQNCVVSLVPVIQQIDEPISLRFVQAGSRNVSSKAAAEVSVDPTGIDPPEVFSGSSIDLGPLVVEHLVLAIDPYPRAPDAAMPENPAEAPPGSADSPFAALAKLGQAGPKGR